ncbi:hypothetical protein D9M72_586960 [compost metagenome]
MRKALADRLILLVFPASDEGQYGHRKCDGELDAELGVVRVHVQGRDEPHHDDAGDELQCGAVELAGMHRGLFHVADPDADNHGSADDVEEDHDVVNDVHGPSLASWFYAS